MPRFCKYKEPCPILLLAGITMLSACGGGGSSNPHNSAPLSGNWQFTVDTPANEFLGGLQGGFLLQKNESVSGAATYAISLPSTSGGVPTLCNSGSAPITGTISNNNVTLTA